jgi:hypothetical protein
MKITLLLIALLFATPVMGQEVSDPAAPPDIVILEKNWREELIDPKRETNPLKPNEDLIRQTREQKAFIRERDNAMPNQPTEPRMPAAGSKPVTPAWQMWIAYTYEAKVQNVGAKTIKLIDWEYQFLDPHTQQVQEQRKIRSWLTLAPGKTKVLSRRSTRKPTAIVEAGQLNRKYRDQFTERVVITRILYADGTVWQRPKTE